MRRGLIVALAGGLACGDSGAASAPGTDSTGSTDAGSSSGTAAGSESTGAPQGPPACGSFAYDWPALVPGPGEADFDTEMADTAMRHDRLHVALNGVPHGMGNDVTVGDPARKEIVGAFLDDRESWDFEASTGTAITDIVDAWQKATGAFAGPAAAADAYRYGTLRDQGASCGEIDRAREQLLRALDGLHLATALTGGHGIVVRAYAHRDWPGASETPTTPLFDETGEPLPPEKNNGTWREDNSGEHPKFVWEDSCSRDQLVGWAAGFGAAWEVTRDDPSFDAALKERLQDDAAAIARQLMTVRESGFDLEIFDADGRTTLHGYLHERNLEGVYLGLYNGFHALMATGIVAALAYVAQDPEIDAYLYDELLGERDLLGVAKSSMLIDFGPASNYSNYNMAFAAAWLAQRYLAGEAVRADLAEVTANLYDTPGMPRQPKETAQTLFDFVAAAMVADASARAPALAQPDQAAVEQGLATLRAFPMPPAWDDPRENCDAAEIEAGVCELDNGLVVELLGTIGHNDALVTDRPIPMEARRSSNYYWRSNPYTPNGDGLGTALASSADFRFVYWLGRWTRL